MKLVIFLHRDLHPARIVAQPSKDLPSRDKDIAGKIPRNLDIVLDIRIL